MHFFIKDMGIETGGIQVVTLNRKDAQSLDIHKGDRVRLKYKSHETIAVLDYADASIVSQGRIGLFFEVMRKLRCSDGDEVKLKIEDKPQSIKLIRGKLDGYTLTKKEIKLIISDIVENKLTETEITFFVSAGYVRGFTMSETLSLTEAMIETGDPIKFGHSTIVDFHSIGGVPGNRTTMIVAPILAAAGLIVPKTSSRAITSPSGTADTMEVLCNVSLDKNQLKEVIKDAGACIAWGGEMYLAPADEKIINIEHPLSIDAEGQMISSIMAKKGSVNATHLLIEIPYGKSAKTSTKKEASELGKKFKYIGNHLNIKTEILITDGSGPIGRGLGPLLEARDVLWVLERDPARPRDLEHRSINMAGKILEMTKKAKKGEGVKLAKKILDAKKAHKKMMDIIYAQGGVRISSDQLVPNDYTYEFKAKKAGTIFYDNKKISKLARLAGAPRDIDAGIFLYKGEGEKVKKNEIIFTLFAANKPRLNYCNEIIDKFDGVSIK